MRPPESGLIYARYSGSRVVPRTSLGGTSILMMLQISQMSRTIFKSLFCARLLAFWGPYMKRVIALLSFVMVVSSCGLSRETKQAGRSAIERPIRRFEITRNLDVAFDTQTGQLCRTWEWEPSSPKPKSSDDGTFPQRAVGEFTPTCLSLYEKYPTNARSIDELMRRLPD